MSYLDDDHALAQWRPLLRPARPHAQRRTLSAEQEAGHTCRTRAGLLPPTRPEQSAPAARPALRGCTARE
eukprot:1549782-Rhodomonas_salina.2